MKFIPLTQGYSAQVDDEDFDWLNQWKWQVRVGRNSIYASRNYRRENGSWGGSIGMHRQIMGVTDPKIQVDHIKGNGLNNQRENLRICTNSQNNFNSVSAKGSSSKFKGVCWNKLRRGWVFQISFEGNKHFGYFKNEEDAARAYNKFAKQYHKEFARFNDVDPMFPETELNRTVLRGNNSSGYRGVSFNKDLSKWSVEISFEGKKDRLGHFLDPTEAAKAYDNAARKYYGDSAKLNFPIIDAGLAKEITN